MHPFLTVQYVGLKCLNKVNGRFIIICKASVIMMTTGCLSASTFSGLCEVELFNLEWVKPKRMVEE